MLAIINDAPKIEKEITKGFKDHKKVAKNEGTDCENSEVSCLSKVLKKWV